MRPSVLELHVGDLDLGERLAVSGVTPIPGPAGEAKDPDLLALAVAHHLGRDLGAFQDGLAGVHLLAVAREQHPIERHLGPGLACEQRDLDGDAGLGLELKAPDRKNRVGHEGRNVNAGNRLVKVAPTPPRIAPSRPDPLRVGRSAVIECPNDGRTRWRVVSVRPSSETANAWVRARSRPKWVRSSCNTFSRLPRDSMSMKSTTMIPPMSRSRSWRATSRAASMFVLRIVLSGSFLPV